MPQVFIPLTQGKFTLIDESDYEYLNQWKWYYIKDGYAVRSDYSNGRPPKQIRMHRQIMREPEGLEVDHRSTDKLDNRRVNLRIATKAQNQQNTNIPKNNTSGYKGVSKTKRGKGYIVHIRKKYLGYFPTPEEGARAYNKAAVELYGDFARLNNV